MLLGCAMKLCQLCSLGRLFESCGMDTRLATGPNGGRLGPNGRWGRRSCLLRLMAFTMNARLNRFGLPAVERTVLDRILPWLHERAGKANELQSLTATLLAINTKEYFDCPQCLTPTLRDLLRRYVMVHELFQAHAAPAGAPAGAPAAVPAAPAIVMEANDEGAEGPTDFFTAEALVPGEDMYYATTEAGAQEEFLATKMSWAYHILLNGAVHPANRVPITAFGSVTLLDVPAAALVHGPTIFDPINLGPLTASLEAAWEPPAGGPARLTLVKFEDVYGIPPERQLSRAAHAAAGGAEAGSGAADGGPGVMGPNGLAVIAGLFGGQAAAQIAMEDAVQVAIQNALDQAAAMEIDPEADPGVVHDIVEAAYVQAMDAVAANMQGAVGLLGAALAGGGAAGLLGAMGDE